MTPGYIWERVFWSFVPAGEPANQSSEDRDGSYLGGVLQEAHAVSESTAYEAVSCASSICVLETSYRTIVENFETSPQPATRTSKLRQVDLET